jgi:peptidoglycan/xylan/chitin deacetylase (PgdA/CDA1 family)
MAERLASGAGSGDPSAFAARVETELTILLYHGVTRARSRGIENYSGKHVAADRFAAEMRAIRRHCTPLAIDEAVALLRDRRPLPRRAVVVSFDDGFANNYSTAAPILDELGLPAVFYVTSGLIGTDRMFWVDQIEDCLNLTAAETVTVTLDRPETLPLRTSDERVAAVDLVKSYCKRAPSEEKDRVVADVAAATGAAPRADHAANYALMSWPELRALAANRLFTVGGHSLHHDILSALPPVRMRQDVAASIALLDRELGVATRHYSYPEGQAEHFNPQVIDALAAHGIVCCPSAVHGLNPPGSSLFHLRRVMVGFRGCPFPFAHLVDD